jgi:polar amino acid transport system permease protein
VSGVRTAWAPSARELERRALRRRLHRRSTAIAIAITVVMFAAAAALVVSSPGWPRFRTFFLDWHFAQGSFPTIAKGFWINVRMFLCAEPLILVVGVLVAVTRNTVTPWLTPVRLVAIVYTDVFRGLPTLLVVTISCLGIPALQLNGLPTNPIVLGVAALVVCYGAYVAEVIRAGIDSIHPSQIASADALALSRAQVTRYVVLPQALRRVAPPLLNDFVSLQKDTSLVAGVAVFESLFAATDYSNYHFNDTSLVVTGVFFLVLTIPLARVTDWMAHRARLREHGR